jgi:hypothetical protein
MQVAVPPGLLVAQRNLQAGNKTGGGFGMKDGK